MKIYLAARYTRRIEMQHHATELAALGHTVTSRRHADDAHLATEEDLLGPDQTLALRLAHEDWDDLEEAELAISFTEEPRAAPSRGGRHVEHGLALALRIEIWIVGPTENIFHSLADERFESWEGTLAELTSRRDRCG